MLTTGYHEGGPPRGEEESRELLVCSHTRCREFVTLAARLARDDTLADERAVAAAYVDRYFRESLPLHIADEEETLMPRLEAAGLDLEERVLLDELRAQHRAIYALLAWLHPAWMTLAREPERFAARHPVEDMELREGASRLAALLGRHLDLEERRLLPVLGRLPLEDRAEVAAEIHARREAAARAADGD